jgi:hypothetical protein
LYWNGQQISISENTNIIPEGTPTLKEVKDTLYIMQNAGEESILFD